jgi:uncharacterized membrane protein YccC
MASRLKRQQAPVVVAGSRLKPNEIIYITYSLIANQKGQPVIQRWLGIQFIDGKFTGIESLESLLKRTGLAQGLPNAGREPNNLGQLKQHLTEVVKQTQQQMTDYRKAFEKENRPKLDAQLEKLAALEEKQVKQMDLFHENSAQIAAIKDKRHKDETDAIRSRFEEYRHWIQETMNTEDQPYIQIIAAIVS